jgi:hypothetical protein
MKELPVKVALFAKYGVENKKNSRMLKFELFKSLKMIVFS